MADAAPLSSEGNTARTLAQRAYEQALISIKARKGKTLQKYGYDTDGNRDATNPYGDMQMLDRQYDSAKGEMSREKEKFSKDFGIEITGDSYKQSGDDGVLQRMGQDHTESLSRIMDARNKTQFAAGLKGRFGADGAPTGLTLSNENQHGAFQRLLSRQGMELDGAEDNAVGRGLGTRGLGAQAGRREQFESGGERQDLRTNLLEMLMGSGRAEKDENTDYSRRQVDVDKGIRESLAEMLKSGKDLDFQHGKNQHDLGTMLAEALASLTNEEYGAEVGKKNADNSAALMDALRAATGAPGPGSPEDSGDGTGASGASEGFVPAPGPKKNETAAERALRLRYEELNARLGLGTAGGGGGRSMVM